MTESKAPSQSEELDKTLYSFLDNGVIDTVFVKRIGLPSMILTGPGQTETRGPILLVLHPCHKASKQVLLAAKEGFKHFKIEWRDANLEVQSTWTLYKAYVSGLDYGIASLDPDAPANEVQCEISYAFLEIDGVKL